MKTREDKEREVALLEEIFRESKALVFTNFHGLNAQEMVELRRLFRENNLRYRVVKNTLARLAAQRVGLKLDEFLVGPTGICFGDTDPTLPCKLSVEAAKKFKAYKIKGGLIEGELVGPDKVEYLAKLPSREELLTKLAYLLNAPLQQLVRDLKGIITKLVIALDEVRKKKESGELAAPAPAAEVEAKAETEAKAEAADAEAAAEPTEEAPAEVETESKSEEGSKGEEQQQDKTDTESESKKEEA